MKNTLSLLAAFVFIFGQMNAQVSLQNFGTGFTRPCDITHCGDDRLFVVEQRGIIWILDKSGNKLPNAFLNIDPSVGSSGNEQGLLGLAFHPDYPQTPYFYVNYTNNSGDTKISRFSVSADDPNLADAASELVVLEADQPFSNHNGGCVKFGPDGYLYIGLGDGGSGGDPQANGQKRTTFLGKMLRIDVDGAAPYAVPDSNPFISLSSTLPEIWALGLRNPWRFSFDRSTGDLWIGDVGQDAWEEIDFQPASSPGGENYGWRCYEGMHTFNTSNCPDVSTLTMPVAEYENSGSLGCSITGGFVYRGFNYPQLYGKYLYTDYCTGRLWSIVPDGAGGWTNAQIADLINNQLVSFGENKNGELFALGNSNGIVYRVVDAAETWTYQVNVVNPPCGGTTDGSIEITVQDNIPMPTVIWEDGSTGFQRNNLPEGTYTAIITGANGATACERVVIEPSISLDAVVTNESCLGAADGAIDLSLNGSTAPPTAVLWNDGSTDLDRTGLTANSYSVSVTSAEGCTVVDSFNINAPFYIPPVIALNQDTVLTADPGYPNYQWLLDGTPIPGATGPTYIATESGIYSVQVIFDANCPSTSNEITVTISATDIIPELKSVNVTPNPFRQSIRLEVTVSEPVFLEMSITDLQGKTFFTERLAVASTSNREFDLGQIPSGTYLLVLKNGKGEWVERLVKI